MLESLLEEINRQYPDKGILTLDEVCKFLDCKRNTVYNWTRRVDPNKRPPRIVVGRTIRFPKGLFVQWLAKEQSVGKGG